MVRKRMIIKGNVQGVGYRALVKKMARTMAVKGMIRNLEDGTVEIYCEGDVAILAKFISMIDIKSRNGSLLAIDVKGMEEYIEGTEGFSKGQGPKEFGPFEIDYGQDISFAEKEMIERQELLIVGGSQMLEGIDTMSGDVRGLGVKIDTVGRSVMGMHGDMNKKFLTMERKYHKINKNIEQSNRNIERLIKGNTRIDKNIERSNRNIERMNENIAGMNKGLTLTSQALVKLVERDISERKKAKRTKKR